MSNYENKMPTGGKDAAGDVTQMTRRSDNDNPPPPSNIFFLQIYTIHVNDLFQGENGEFRRKVTSLHPCKIPAYMNWGNAMDSDRWTADMRKCELRAWMKSWNERF